MIDLRAIRPLAALACLGLWACSPAPEDAAPLQNGLLYCAEGNPESFNPQLVTSGTTLDMTATQLYDSLINYDDDTQQFTPALATSWDISDDGKTYRFTLREDVPFHNTAYFTPTRLFSSQDVVFTFQRWLNSAHPFHQISTTGYPFFSSIGLDKLIANIYAVNEHEVVIQLHQSDSSFLANLASDFAIILSAEYADTLTREERLSRIDSHPVGTGPFKFQDFRKDVSVRYQRHDSYWQGPARSERLVFRIIPSDHKRMLMLLTDDCDIVPYPPARDIADLETNENIQLYSTVSPNTAFWAFNTQRPPFDDVRVRQALIHAIDRRAILNAVYFDRAALAYSILPNTSWAHYKDEDAFSYNPEMARELLADAGFPNGFSMNIWAMPVQRAYNPDAAKMAELMQADLARVGVNVNIVSYEWSTFRRRLGEGDHDSVLIGWSADNPDPDNFFRPLLSCAAVLSGSNRAHWCNPEFDRLVAQAIRTSDQNERIEYYHQVQRLLNDQVPLMPIVHSMRYQAAHDNVRDLILRPYGGIQLQKAYKERPQ